MIDVENSPSGLWRTLGKRVGVTASRVRISYSPRVGVLANKSGWNPFSYLYTLHRLIYTSFIYTRLIYA